MFWWKQVFAGSFFGLLRHRSRKHGGGSVLRMQGRVDLRSTGICWLQQAQAEQAEQFYGFQHWVGAPMQVTDSIEPL